jgi:Flp pilus assembly protein TadD
MKAAAQTAENSRRREFWLIPALIALATAIVFLPALRNGFVSWDDGMNFYENFHFRGLGRAQLSWMFLYSSQRFNYEPLTWLLYGLTFVIFGIKPFGYHLVGLLSHLATTAAFYFVALRLFKLASPGSEAKAEDHRRWAAAVAALFFAIHPLRVEVVAWASGQHYAFCGFFFIASIWAYLRSRDNDKDRLRWLAVSVAFHAAALAFYSIVMTLPAVLLILDVYPLKRFSNWRAALLEKIPYLALSAAAAAAMLGMRARNGSIVDVARFGFLGRIAQSFYGIAFCLWKTIIPFHLLPLYELPIHFDPFAPVFILGAAAVVALTGGFFALRRVWPAALAVWIYSVVTLSPVLGIVLAGSQLTADRYTYLPSLGWSLLAGAGVLSALRSSRYARAVPFVLAFLGLGLGVLTWRQIDIWRDTDTLWTYALSINPACILGQNNIAVDLVARNRAAEAVPHLQEALRLKPDYAEAHYNLGVALDKLGRLDEAQDRFRRALALKPDYVQAHINVGALLARQGRRDEAVTEFREALRIDPASVDASSNLTSAAADFNNVGLALAGKGRFADASADYVKALALVPDYPDAHYNLANALSVQGKFGEAVGHYREVLKAYPRNVAVRNNLGVALLRTGNPAEAAAQFREVLALAPSDPDAKAKLEAAERAARR